MPEPSRVLVMEWVVRGEMRFVVGEHEQNTSGRVIDEAVRQLVGVYGLDPTSVRFRWAEDA